MKLLLLLIFWKGIYGFYGGFPSPENTWNIQVRILWTILFYTGMQKTSTAASQVGRTPDKITYWFESEVQTFYYASWVKLVQRYRLYIFKHSILLAPNRPKTTSRANVHSPDSSQTDIPIIGDSVFFSTADAWYLLIWYSRFYLFFIRFFFLFVQCVRSFKNWQISMCFINFIDFTF